MSTIVPSALGALAMSCGASLVACAGVQVPDGDGDGQPAPTSSELRLTADGELLRPEDYRRWMYIGTPLTPNALNPPEAPFPEFHNTYMDTASFDHWSNTGTWREGTVIIKELLLVGATQAASGKGFFQGDFVGLEAAVKSAEHFPDEPGNWAYFSFGHAYPLADTASKFEASKCNSCHGASADDDFVFTQYYPILTAARSDR